MRYIKMMIGDLVLAHLFELDSESMRTTVHYDSDKGNARTFTATSLKDAARQLYPIIPPEVRPLIKFYLADDAAQIVKELTSLNYNQV